MRGLGPHDAGAGLPHGFATGRLTVGVAGVVDPGNFAAAGPGSTTPATALAPVGYFISSFKSVRLSRAAAASLASNTPARSSRLASWRATTFSSTVPAQMSL